MPNEASWKAWGRGQARAACKFLRECVKKIKIVMYRHPTGTFPDYRRRLGSVTLTGQGLGLGLGTSLFPVGAMEIKGNLL